MKYFVYWPLAMHPDPKSAVLIGFGAGSTADAILIAFNVGVPLVPPIAAGVQPGSPAARAGFLPGDRVLEVDGTRVIDWGSRNGLYVNQKRVTEHFLRNGDSVRIGTADFRYEERAKRDA